MPIIVTCSLCGRSTDVQHFDVYLRTNRKNQPMRAGAGGLDLCSACWTKYAMPFSSIGSWGELLARQQAVLVRRKATELEVPQRRKYLSNA